MVSKRETSVRTSVYGTAVTPLNAAVLASLLLGIVWVGPSHGQGTRPDPDWTIESALENAEVDDDRMLRTIESLSFRILEPLNINTATADELAAIPAITPLVALRIVLHRDRHGPFLSYDSLRVVDGLTDDAWREAAAFLTVVDVAEPTPHSRRGIELVQRIGRRTASDSGSNAAYAGGPERIYTRLSLRGERHLSANVTLDKDPGEAFQWNPAARSYGYDFISTHVAIRDVGKLRTLVVGDFTANFGQGLVLSSGSAFGKGSDPIRSATRLESGLKPYRSSDEFHFFRGIGATASLSPGISATLFGSRRRIDGSLVDDCGTDTTARCIRGFTTSGLHRSDLELERKGVQTASVVGGALEFRRGATRIGATAYRNVFEIPLAPGKNPYERFDFAGKQVSAFSVYAQAYTHDILVFGEAAHSPEGGPGGLGGLLMHMSERAQATVLFRYYPASFVDLYGDGFGERSTATRNETGIYAGIRLVPHQHLSFEGYFDQYRFPWLGFGVSRPTTGYDALARLEYRPNSRFRMMLQARSEAVERGAQVQDASGRLLRSVAPEHRTYLRTQVTYSIGEAVRTRTRLERSRTRDQDAREQGVLVYQDVRWQPSRQFRLDIRLTYYDTDGYRSRIYAFENDVLHAFAIPALSGRGTRAYVLTSMELMRSLTLQAKYGYTQAVRDGAIGPEAYSARDLNLLLRLTM